MREAVGQGVFPGGVLLVAHKGAICFFNAYGRANIFTGCPVEKHTVFDLASLTKPLATTLAVMKLIQMRRMHLTDTLGSVLPAFVPSQKSRITIMDLLTHQSGLPAHRPYYEQLKYLPLADRRKALRTMLLKEALIPPVGKNPVYSDLGFMILAWIVETISGWRLDLFLKKEIYAPLGLEDLFFPGLEGKSLPYAFAATERCRWRKRLLEGVVHDDNAFVVGGIEGHAGLFGTAGSVYGLLNELLKAYRMPSDRHIIPPALARCFLTRRPDAHRALGFDTPSIPVSSCGHHFSAETVGHLGFTGTSFWMDLAQSVIVVLLTNRVHPDRYNLKIKEFRPVLHDAVMRAIGLAPYS